MFSNLSSSSISLATVTPSLVTRGAPKDFSSTTLRPLGPSVTRTALERMSIPRSILSRASPENFTSFAAICFLLRIYLSGLLSQFRSTCARSSGGFLASPGFLQHAHKVAFLHDQVFDAIELDLGP